jgi:hypothetical protein
MNVAEESRVNVADFSKRRPRESTREVIGLELSICLKKCRHVVNYGVGASHPVTHKGWKRLELEREPIEHEVSHEVSDPKIDREHRHVNESAVKVVWVLPGRR